MSTAPGCCLIFPVPPALHLHSYIFQYLQVNFVPENLKKTGINKPRIKVVSFISLKVFVITRFKCFRIRQYYNRFNRGIEFMWMYL